MDQLLRHFVGRFNDLIDVTLVDFGRVLMLADKLCHHLVLLVHGLGARVNVTQFGLIFFNLVIDFLIMNIKRDFDVDERANQFPVL